MRFDNFHPGFYEPGHSNAISTPRGAYSSILLPGMRSELAFAVQPDWRRVKSVEPMETPMVKFYQRQWWFLTVPVR